MSNSNRDKSHSEGSDRHICEPLKDVLHNLQGKRLRNVATNTSRSDEFPAHSQKTPHRGGNSEIIQWVESTIIQTSYQKYKGLEKKKREASKEEGSVASTSKPQAGTKNRKRNFRKPHSPSYRIPIFQKDSMDNVFKMFRALMEFKDKEEQIMRQPHFPKK
ncbi:hypothetical protein O181_132901 [Austropuccinia psidii MF-1]|uniref:Uncharacterized protein n=1 Tax=Austropuccinia psidii MF-1 TaxID=1389203 RepID=A0A9Q3L759_9BASI|nr:hypothetical protein [Austropuccinia psidii MF-1]